MKALRLILGLAVGGSLAAQTPRLVRTLPLPGVAGRIDHLSRDAAGGRLFVAALGNNTVEVVDLHAGTVARSLDGFSEPQGLLYVPEFNRLYVANGGDGSVHILDGTTFAPVATVTFDDDADNLRYDAAAKNVYVGYGSGALGMIAARSNTVVGTIALPAHPESFQLEAAGTRVFVNVPGAHTLAVVDRASRQVVAHWPLGLAAANFPLALDAAHHRLLVGCRAPARLLVFDTETGKEVAKLDLHGDCDDLFVDAARHLVYASCGEGYLDVFAVAASGDVAPRNAVKTIPGARTCTVDAEHLYLAVPRQHDADAHLAVYALDR